MSSCPFTEMHLADHLAGLLCPQLVRPLALSPKYTLLTLLRPAPPSGCTSTRPCTEMHSTDLPAASLHPQDVRPLVFSLKCTLLTHPRPHLALSMYVLSSFHRNAPCRPSCGLTLHSACMSSRPFTEMHPADGLAVSPCPQLVRPLVLSPKCTQLILVRPLPALSLYVLSPFHRNVPR